MLAVRAIEVVEDDTGSVVHFLNLLLGAFEMINVTTFKNHAWLLTNGGTVTD